VIRAQLLDLGSPCSSLSTPGLVTPKHTGRYICVPNLAGTGLDPVNGLTDTPAPSWLSRFCSPSIPAETWINVRTCTIMHSVQEVIVFYTASVLADLLRHREDGAWPDNPEPVLEGNLVLQCIGPRMQLDFDCSPLLHPGTAA